MLRITVQDTGNLTEIKLEGVLQGPWNGELERCWQSARNETNNPVVVDLNGVDWLDISGLELLKDVYQEGGQLTGRSLLAQFVIQWIEDRSLEDIERLSALDDA